MGTSSEEPVSPPAKSSVPPTRPKGRIVWAVVVVVILVVTALASLL